MRPIVRVRRWLSMGFGTGLTVVALVAIAPLASASGSSAAGTVVPSCSAASTFVWAAHEGSGTAGTTFYDLELSNVGSTTCTLRGNPAVWAVTTGGVEVGKPAIFRGTATTVTLAPGGTAHVVLGVVDTGAVCGSEGVQAAGLRVVPPGQTLPTPRGERDEVENFAVEVCPHQSSMNVLPAHAGVGIPLHTLS